MIQHFTMSLPRIQTWMNVLQWNQTAFDASFDILIHITVFQMSKLPITVFISLKVRVLPCGSINLLPRIHCDYQTPIIQYCLTSAITWLRATQALQVRSRREISDSFTTTLRLNLCRKEQLCVIPFCLLVSVGFVFISLVDEQVGIAFDFNEYSSMDYFRFSIYLPLSYGRRWCNATQTSLAGSFTMQQAVTLLFKQVV